MDFLQEYIPVKIFGDNQGAIALSRDPVHQQRTKHRHKAPLYHNDCIDIIYCPTADILAEIMTKPTT